MKSLSIKIPVKMAVDMDDNNNLNPVYLKDFINRYKDCEFSNEPCPGLTLPYTFKIDAESHRAIKLAAIGHEMAMNEFICRLLQQYYWRDRL